jgi:hypothetical protein
MPYFWALRPGTPNENTGIIAAHIWKASTRGHGLEESGLRNEDVKNPKKRTVSYEGNWGSV